LGENLRRYRKACGLSREAFADVLGVHRTYIGGLERGERDVSLRALERYADRLGIEPMSLLDTDGAVASPQIRPGGRAAVWAKSAALPSPS
jgi:transcriptional regulator with XRE-family HTH domain